MLAAPPGAGQPATGDAVGRCLVSVAEVELGEDALHVVLDRVLADHQTLGDRGVGKARRHQLQDVQLSSRERFLANKALDLCLYLGNSTGGTQFCPPGRAHPRSLPRSVGVERDHRRGAQAEVSLQVAGDASYVTLQLAGPEHQPGSLEEEVQIAALDVQQALQSENIESPGGRIVRGPSELGVRTMGRIEHVK